MSTITTDGQKIEIRKLNLWHWYLITGIRTPPISDSSVGTLVKVLKAVSVIEPVPIVDFYLNYW